MGLVGFQNKKKSRPLFIIIFNSKMLVSRPEIFSPLILGVLGGVIVFEIALQRQVCSISDLKLARGLLESQNGPFFCKKIHYHLTYCLYGWMKF